MIKHLQLSLSSELEDSLPDLLFVLKVDNDLREWVFELSTIESVITELNLFDICLFSTETIDAKHDEELVLEIIYIRFTYFRLN